MASIPFVYGVTFGSGDYGDLIDWDVAVDEKTAAIYQRAVKLRQSFDVYPELNNVYDQACEDIMKYELDNILEYDDEYAAECLGKVEVDADEINDLVEQRDQHTMEFFGLTEMSDEDLEEWDAYDLDELPDVCDFEEDFEATNPFEEAWSLNVSFAHDYEDEAFEEAEARSTLTELMLEANGDYAVIDSYISRCESDYYDSDLAELAIEIAENLGIDDYVRCHS